MLFLSYMQYGRIITCILKIKAEDTTETWIVCFQPGVNSSSCEKPKPKLPSQLRRFNASNIRGEKIRPQPSPGSMIHQLPVNWK